MKKHQELIFIIIGILLLLMTAGFIVYSMNFLIKSAGEAVNQESVKAKEIDKFNLEGLKKLGITE